MNKEAYFNPLSRGRCLVTASSVQVGILPTLVENSVGYFTTQEEPQPWFQVRLNVTHKFYPDHYVLGGSETGHRDDMMRSWALEGSMDGEAWELLREHREEQCFTDAEQFCGPKGWQCFSLPPTGPFRYFRIRHTGVTLGGNHALLASGFELFGHLVVDADEE
eukprot:TRINITY_DN10251_c0_g1_i6.p1 TRINITY_DN10251_c0_g1~~TRINITY_DN10251_c0_g1_i6.p1  ORF type:complete len:163 (-),score=27.03 TRINITY_DN10251_c0_g1_i6:101-589(-)